MEATNDSGRRRSWIQTGNLLLFKVLTEGCKMANGVVTNVINSVGDNIVGTFKATKDKVVSTAKAAKKKMFELWTGIDGISRKKCDENAPQSNQSDEKAKAVSFNIPEGETVDPESLNAQSHGESAKLDILQGQNSSSMTLKKPMLWGLLSGASPQIKYMAILMLRASRAKSEMDKCLKEILEINERNDMLSKQAKDESQKAADTKQDASVKECSANKWGAWGQLSSTLGGICGGLGALMAGVAGAAGAAIPPIAATAFAIGGASLTHFSFMRKSEAARDTHASDLTQANVQSIKDEQSINSVKANTLQSLFSTASQEYNTTLNILQATIASENEAKRTTAANIR
ncbi:MAG: hypothetical protein LBC30_02220 [Puniceicoccales bacterium]|jgi:hypothetical protein|nr:hypothetical protein [Puniceicoccales bacterium]